MMNILKAIPAVIGGVAAYLWGPWDALIMVLIGVVVLDYLTGVINALIHHRACSAACFTGILKKVLIFVLVALAALVDKLIPATNDAVRAAVIIFYIANEGLSILENAGEMGLPLPKILKDSLLKLREKAPEEDIGEEEERPQG